MSIRRLAIPLAFSLLTLVGCKSEPTLDGQSLICTKDASCPDGFRCYSGGCIRNGPPVIEPLGVLVMGLGSGLDVTPTVTDPENDVVTLTWTQLDGPEDLITGSVESPSLTATPTVAGGFLFEVQASDGYDTSAVVTVSISVIDAPVSGDAIYVSQLGSDAAGCGDLMHPCATVATGLAARASAAVPVLVAAGGATPYVECLAIDDAAVVLGGFDPLNWAYDAQEDPTEIACDVSGGHTITANASLRDLTLTSIVAAPAAFEATLHVTSAAPILEDLTVQAPSCDGCVAVAVDSVGASPELIGVDMRGAPLIEFDFPDHFIGLFARGGAPVVTGRRATDGSITRGKISLTAPSNYSAVAVVGVRSDISVDDVRLLGGAAPLLAGFELVDGAPAVHTSDIQLSGFNTRFMYGVAYRACGSASWDCVCDVWTGGCPAAVTALPYPAAGSAAALTFEGSSVSLVGTADQPGLVACLGAGLDVEGSIAAVSIADNAIDVGDNFTLAAGAIVSGAVGGTPLSATIERNSVSLGQGSTDAVCVVNNRALAADFPNGAVGMYVGHIADSSVADNDVTVGGHDYLAMGLLVEDHAALSITHNIVDVGRDTAPSDGLLLAGATLDYATVPDVGSESTFTRNEVLVRRGASTTVGLTVAGLAHWTVENNFVFGGRGKTSIGLQLAPTTLEAEWPKIIHNTIHGGGDALEGLTSRAVLLAGTDAADATSTAPSGIVDNNLLDAGFSPGRRFVLDNPPKRSFLASATGNVAQFDQTIGGPRPTTPVVTVRVDVSAGVASATLADAYYVVLPTTGEIAYLQPDNAGNPTAFSIGGALPVGEAIGATWFGSDSSAYERALLAATSNAIWVGIASPSRGYFQAIHNYPTNTASGDVVVPTSLLLADTNSDKESEIVLLADDGAGGQALWRMGPDGSGGFLPPVAWIPKIDAGELTAPQLISRGQTAASLIVVDASLGAHLWSFGRDTPLSLDLKAAVPTGQVVNQIFTADFGDASPTPELVAIIDGHLYIWRNVTTQADLTTPLPIRDDGGAAYIPCGDPATNPALTATIGDLDAGLTLQQELAVLCADHTLELYTYYVVQNRLDMTGPPYDTGAASDALAITSSESILVTQPAANAVHYLKIASYQVASDVALQLYPDVAMRDLTTGQDSDVMTDAPVDTGITLYAAADPPACGLVLQANRSATYDLHLTGTSSADNACIDAGDTSVVVATDIDGQARSDGLPDVGADEVP